MPPPRESSFNLSAVSELVLDSTPMLWRSTFPYLSEEYPIKGLLISSSRKFGISPIIWLLIRCFAPGRLKGPRLWRMPGGPPASSGLLRSWLALGAFLVRLDVTLIMSTWSGSTGGPACAIIFGSKKSSPSSSSSSHPACEAGGGGILGPGPLRRMLNSCSLKAISFCRRASSLSRRAISGPPAISYPPSVI